MKERTSKWLHTSNVSHNERNEAQNKKHFITFCFCLSVPSKFVFYPTRFAQRYEIRWVSVIRFVDSSMLIFSFITENFLQFSHVRMAHPKPSGQVYHVYRLIKSFFLVPLPPLFAPFSTPIPSFFYCSNKTQTDVILI